LQIYVAYSQVYWKTHLLADLGGACSICGSKEKFIQNSVWSCQLKKHAAVLLALRTRKISVTKIACPITTNCFLSPHVITKFVSHFSVTELFRLLVADEPVETGKEIGVVFYEEFRCCVSGLLG
jgi:hypothetical protein